MVRRMLRRLTLVVLIVVGGAVGSLLPGAQAGAQDVADQDEIVKQIGPKKGVVVVADPDDTDPVPSDQQGMALPAIQFEYDSARFTPLARKQVDELGKALLQPALLPFVFSLQGHTDSIGSAAYNRDLSLRRALAVKRRLVDGMGVTGERLIEVGFGEGYPITGILPDDQRNRRVEIVNRGRIPADGILAAHERGQEQIRRALLVGIGEYQNFSRLPGAPNDARAMAAFLAEHGGFAASDIRLLTDSEATRSNILAVAREWLIDGTRAGDEALLFFSGHGFQQWDEDRDEVDGKDETLVPVDAYLDSDGNVQGMITDDEIGVLLDELDGRQVRVVIDACHSGTSTKGVGVDDGWQYAKTLRLPDGSPMRLAADPGARNEPGPPVHKGDLAGVTGVESVMRSDDPNVVVWTAVRADQSALLDREASGDTAGSVYTRRLLWGARDGKADANGDGTVAIDELHHYVQKESDAYCGQHPRDCRNGLTPQLEVMPSRANDLAFGLTRSVLSRTAAFTKDVFVQAADQASPAVVPAVRLRVDPGPKIEPGTEINITVDSDRDGYLMVLDVDAEGKLVQLFPNEESLRVGVPPKVRAGEPVSLPGEQAGFRFRAVPPLGRGLLVAVVSDKAERIGLLTGRHKDLAVVQSPEAYVIEAAEALQADSGDERSESAWSVGTLDYEIISSDQED